MRKIVQITTVIFTRTSAGVSITRPLVHVLCDDGTVWADTYEFKSGERSWVQLPEIPQD